MLKNIFLGLAGLLLIATVSSCKRSCPIHCYYGGSCVNNVCQCPDPYSGNNCDTLCPQGQEGYMCQVLSRDRFLGGAWSCTSSDQSGISKTYLITFTANSYPLFMNMNNFNQSGDSIICTLSGKYKFDINNYLQDSVGPFVNANGQASMSDGKITMNIQTATNTFFATAVRQ